MTVSSIGADAGRAGAGAWIWRNVGFIAAAVALLFCAIHAFDPPRLNWGDPGSDFNTMEGGRNFREYGFLGLQLTPYLLDPKIMTSADSVMIYTHYPPLPVWANGVMRYAGMSELVQFRFAALVISFASLFFVYQLAARFWSRQTAQVTVALWVLNPLWIQHADYLHHVPYATLFGFGSVYLLVRYLEDRPSARWLAASGVSLCLTILSSYDWWFFAPLLILLVTLAHYRRLSRPAIGVLSLLAAFTIAGVAIKVATNAWALGGWAAFVHDLRFQFQERATDAVTQTEHNRGIWPVLYGRAERFFTILIFPLLVFWGLARWLPRSARGAHEAVTRVRANPAWLFVAALPFLIAFRELWIAQYYPMLLLLPFYAVGFGAVVTMLVETPLRGARAAGVALFVALVANSAVELATFKPAFLDRKAITALRAQLDTLAPPDNEILVDHVFDAQYRYYFRRKINAMILEDPFRVESHLAFITDPRRQPGLTSQGTLFVQHKRLTDEMYDKGYYYILARYRLWEAWGNPPRYRRFLDSLIADRDSALVARVAARGEKLYESDYYTLWRLLPAAAAPPPRKTTRLPSLR